MSLWLLWFGLCGSIAVIRLWVGRYGSVAVGLWLWVGVGRSLWASSYGFVAVDRSLWADCYGSVGRCGSVAMIRLLVGCCGSRCASVTLTATAGLR